MIVVGDVKEVRERLLKERHEEKKGPDYPYAEGVLDATNELIKKCGKG